jgi:hypothetical protein
MSGVELILWTIAAMAAGGAVAVYGLVAWVLYDDEREMYDTAPWAAVRAALWWPLDWWHGTRTLTGKDV